MKATKASDLRLREVDKVEVISLVDNSVDFLSTVSHRQVESFWQWTRQRYGQKQHPQLPLAEHGFSMLIKTFKDEKSETFLFDTGGSPKVIVENSKIMGLNLNEVGFIVLSHGHYDHFGGLASVVEALGKENLPLIVHEDMFKARGTASRDGTIRRYPLFPTQAQLASTHAIFTKQPFLTANGHVCVTGEIPRKTLFEKGLMQHQSLVNGSWQPDPIILDDRAVAMNVKGKGLVVVSGCAHAGIINTIQYAKQISGVEQVYAVIGGFHLAGKSFEEKIEPTIKELTKINPELIVPSHCTGWRAMFAMSQALPNAFIWNSVGNLYQL
jgi:7,8-dihydropterin-6-yl-methyl-4-(beta-D-ribofuranosyl)aminobenzene 5'-phosphate synthase